MHARTLEFYCQLGFAKTIADAGTQIGGIRLLEGGRERAHVRLGDVGEGLSPYPFILDFPQDEHERFLVDRLREAGVEVERNTTLVSFAQDASGVDALIAMGGREQSARFAYLCGCDGARSVVRKGLGVEFDRGAYAHLHYVADVRLTEPDRGHDFHLAMGADTFALRLPSRRGEMERLIGLAPDGVETPTFEDVKADAERLLRIRVEALNWFSTYRVQHRRPVQCRTRLPAGRCGPPAQPRWRPGFEHRHRGCGEPGLEAVRGGPRVRRPRHPRQLRARAHRLRAPPGGATDRPFRVVVSEGLAGRLFRTLAMPTLIPAATRVRLARLMLFRTASQIGIHYPDSPSSAGRAGGVRGGDRLPWLKDERNFDTLGALDWRLHVYGVPRADLTAAAERRGIALDNFSWSENARQAGFAENAAYLVRPGGHVGLAAADDTTGALDRYADLHTLSVGRS